ERVLLDEIRNFNPTGVGKVNFRTNYCKNKHQKILQKVDVSEVDSCLSELEDEIMKTCQISSPKDNEYKKPLPKTDIFKINKEPIHIPTVVS
ncbi:hypothetical protein U2071_15645, partial [Listeria monocytogenes]|uniref:hypothetical protein n=1 Tax=Listeria monocytogenes TaxID=1639 RepID=UPI002FDBC113